jgi:hypothetical protein
MRFHELRARQSAAIAYGGEGEAGSTASQETIAAGQRRDAEVLAANKQTYDRQYRHWAKMSGLAQRILQRDLSAYTESIQEFSPLAELTELGTNMEFTVHSASLIECVLSMKDTSVIPSEIKSLTAGGKLSIKTMPRARFHELFQDYICSGVLRVARELFAMLPIEHALITAQTAILDTATGASADKPVISVGIPREAIEKITWNAVDPSDAIDRMLHRGDFKASRKTGAFLPIAPLTPREIAGQKPMAQSLENLRAQVSTLHRDIVSMLEEPSTV